MPMCRYKTVNNAICYWCGFMGEVCWIPLVSCCLVYNLSWTCGNCSIKSNMWAMKKLRDKRIVTINWEKCVEVRGPYSTCKNLNVMHTGRGEGVKLFSLFVLCCVLQVICMWCVFVQLVYYNWYNYVCDVCLYSMCMYFVVYYNWYNYVCDVCLYSMCMYFVVYYNRYACDVCLYSMCMYFVVYYNWYACDVCLYSMCYIYYIYSPWKTSVHYIAL